MHKLDLTCFLKSERRLDIEERLKNYQLNFDLIILHNCLSSILNSFFKT